MPTTALGAGGPVESRIGLGLAALGRPAYITSGRQEDLPDRSVAGLRARTFSMLDAAYAAGVRYADAARSYGRAEEFLAGWLAERGYADVIAGSKWGYRYTGGWRLDAPVQEVKEHSLAMFTTQLAQSRALLGDRLTLYQVHSLTPDSALFTDAPLLAALTALAAARGVTEDAIALAAALAQPWASVVLSGAVTRAQLDENLAALTVGQLPDLGLAEDPGALLRGKYSEVAWVE
jgi:aryl-alcohol dehydrogenase-like predicted oxidoreductase